MKTITKEKTYERKTIYTNCDNTSGILVENMLDNTQRDFKKQDYEDADEFKQAVEDYEQQLHDDALIAVYAETENESGTKQEFFKDIYVHDDVEARYGNVSFFSVVVDIEIEGN